MSDLSEILQELTRPGPLSAAVRLTVAMICGGIIGLERGRRRRPAGFRTHMLVCMGAALTMLIGQYVATRLAADPSLAGRTTDPARLGAQVVAGIGFIGAGTIIVTRRRQVKGLTTAAGLWVSAIIGLAIGVGYYEAAILTTVFVIIAETVLSKIEWHIATKAKKLNLYIEYTTHECIGEVAEVIKQAGAGIMDIELTRSQGKDGAVMNAIFSIQLNKKVKRHQMLLDVQRTKGVVSIEEL